MNIQKFMQSGRGELNKGILSAFIYHIYPYGLCGCFKNDGTKMKLDDGTDALTKMISMFKDLKDLGVTAIYIGPVFASTFHGYDIFDYFCIDKRLGNNASMKNFCKTAHEYGFKIIFDAVFNHTGRDFFAFKDLQQNGWKSKYIDWYENLTFDRCSSRGDNFDYAVWQGCDDLAKLNVENTEVRNYLFSALKFWIKEFDIDGIRCDAAHLLPFSFLQNLRAFSNSLKNDFWLIGEVVHGNYKNWINKNRLDSVTNYQICEQFYKSFNENDFEILANELNREFASFGIYENLPLYNFLDNHDINRIASNLRDNDFLFALYAILFTIPGIPAVYYGSELGIKGIRTDVNDLDLRPVLPPFSSAIPNWATPEVNSKKLYNTIKLLANIRHNSNALKFGNFQSVIIEKNFYCYKRQYEGETFFVAINSGEKTKKISLEDKNQVWKDIFMRQKPIDIQNIEIAPKETLIIANATKS